MQILLIGDIVGRPGRHCIRDYLNDLRNKLHIDLVIANGENAAGGFGITEAVFRELIGYGVDIITSGNHVWDNKDVFGFIDREPKLIRPANYPAATTPGRGTAMAEVNGARVGILNLAGRVYMPPAGCPFSSAEEEVALLQQETDLIVVDIHAEATAEKKALGWFLDGRVSAVLGTHTHVQTADERILPRGTAYISDVGATGLFDSILGVDPDPVIFRFMTQLPSRFTISEGKLMFNGVLVEVDEITGRACTITRLFEVIEGHR